MSHQHPAPQVMEQRTNTTRAERIAKAVAWASAWRLKLCMEIAESTSLEPSRRCRLLNAKYEAALHRLRWEQRVIIECP